MQPNAAQLVTVALYASAIAAWLVLMKSEWRIAGSDSTIMSQENLSAKATKTPNRRRSRAWLVIGLVLLALLTLDRFFWLNHVIADQLRELAHHHGWYHRRRKLQVVILACTAILLLPIGVLIGRANRNQTSACSSVSNLIVALLAAFCFARALSNHYVDRVLVYSLEGFRVHWLLEWTLLIALIVSLAYEVMTLGRRRRML